MFICTLDEKEKKEIKSKSQRFLRLNADFYMNLINLQFVIRIYKLFTNLKLRCKMIRDLNQIDRVDSECDFDLI